jgi:ribosomal protein S18 acetylase RimI-like enzyme
MTWHVTDDVEQFLAAAGDLLLPTPGVHTVTLTICENVRARPDGTRFAYWQLPDGEVTGAASQTPGFPVLLAVVPEEALRPLVDVMSNSGVNGPTDLAVHYAALAAHVEATTPTLLHAERLFRLGGLVVPAVAGRARPATEADTELLVEWFEAFIVETGVIPQDVRVSVADRIGFQGLWVWEDGGEAVALAGRTRVAFGAGRIGPVYTPPGHRCRGYGGAVTAAATQALLDAGAWEIVLFTDLTNETSNALYPRLGYRPVTDRAVLTLG